MTQLLAAAVSRGRGCPRDPDPGCRSSRRDGLTPQARDSGGRSSGGHLPAQRPLCFRGDYGIFHPGTRTLFEDPHGGGAGMDAPKLRKLIKRLHKLRGQYQEYMDEKGNHNRAEASRLLDELVKDASSVVDSKAY